MEAIHWRSAIELLRVSCVEFAFKLTPDFATFQQAWQAVLTTAAAFAAQGRYPFNRDDTQAEQRRLVIMKAR